MHQISRVSDIWIVLFDHPMNPIYFLGAEITLIVTTIQVSWAKSDHLREMPGQIAPGIRSLDKVSMVLQE